MTFLGDAALTTESESHETGNPPSCVRFCPFFAHAVAGMWWLYGRRSTDDLAVGRLRNSRCVAMDICDACHTLATSQTRREQRSAPRSRFNAWSFCHTWLCRIYRSRIPDNGQFAAAGPLHWVRLDRV